jgi:hypothetical protein
MPEDRKVSFTTRKSVRYSKDFDIVNCEKIHISHIDDDKRPEIIIPRSSSSGKTLMAEIAVYDLDLNLKASDSWKGTAMDVAVAHVNGTAQIMVAGSIKNSKSMIRVYRYNENYKGNL